MYDKIHYKKKKEISGTTLKHQYSHYRCLRRRKEREKGPEEIFQEILAENFSNMGNSHPIPGSTETPRQDKPKEEHTETHRNQSEEN